MTKGLPFSLEETSRPSLDSTEDKLSNVKAFRNPIFQLPQALKEQLARCWMITAAQHAKENPGLHGSRRKLFQQTFPRSPPGKGKILSYTVNKHVSSL